MDKKFTSILLALVICLTMLPTAFAMDSISTSEKNLSPDMFAGHTIVFIDLKARNMPTYDSSDIVAISEEQLIFLGSQIKDILKTAGMVYVTSAMTDEEILAICSMETLINSEPDKSNTRIGTAITVDGAYYKLADTYAIYQEDSMGSSSVDIPNAINENINLMYDGIGSVLDVQSTTIQDDNSKLRLAPTGAYSSVTKSAVVYDNGNTKIGTMGYTLYFYKQGTNAGTGRVFDSICISTFAPLTGYKCSKMSVYLGTDKSTHEVIDAANIVSNGSSTTNSLKLEGSKTEVSGGGTKTWSYTVDAQTVTKSFDMTTNDRKWTFEPKSAGNGDAWIEEPGVRIYSTSTTCYTTVRLECPYTTIFNIELSNNTLENTHSFTYS